MVRNFFRASAGESAAILRGDPEMPGEEITRRHDLCRSNVCGQYLASGDRCAACGCHVAKKVAWRTASCPDGHWSALSPVLLPKSAPSPGGD